ncbi:MAG: NAD(P)H-dependent oxidoreductase [Patescibacteria group bacterium]|nr:NAD(P)H-dependent oxidoreductase [Patescibacteria group bacterium]
MIPQKPLKILIILGSTRPNRFSEKPGHWLLQKAQQRKDLEVELADLRDYPLPFFNEPLSPRMANGKYDNEIVKKWQNKVGWADGYIMICPEYNHGYTAVLKNALDYVYFEWNKKPVGFVSYGSAGGARAIEQLREVILELEMVSLKASIHIPWQVYMAVIKPQPDNPEPFSSLNEHADLMLDQLTWWARVLKNAREEK